MNNISFVLKMIFFKKYERKDPYEESTSKNVKSEKGMQKIIKRSLVHELEGALS